MSGGQDPEQYAPFLEIELPSEPADGGPAHRMSLRDHFAGLAMQGLLTHSDDFECYADAAYDAYKAADAMIAARKEKQ